MLNSRAKVAYDFYTFWDAVVGLDFVESDDEIAQASHLAQGNPQMRGAMTLKAIERLRDALDAIPSDAAPGDPVVLRVADAVVLARHLLKGFS